MSRYYRMVISAEKHEHGTRWEAHWRSVRPIPHATVDTSNVALAGMA